MHESPTEPPSPQKLRRARREGRVVRSPELATAAVLLGAVAVLAWGGAAGLAVVRGLFLGTFAAVASGAPDPLLQLQLAAGALGRVLAPVLLGLAAASLLAGMLQVGALWAPGAVRPELRRLDPLTRVRAWLSAGALAELGWSALAFVLVVAACAFALGSAATGLVALPAAGPAHALVSLSSLGTELMLRVGVLLLAVGVASLAPRYLALRRSLRMGRREVLEEQREQHGDPLIRDRRRRMREQAAYQAAASDLEQAQLVILGSGARVVGLGLADDAAAPAVVARGDGELGRRLLARAGVLGITSVHAPALARRLAGVELGETVPGDTTAALARLWPPPAPTDAG